jgi:hypothetical protein
VHLLVMLGKKSRITELNELIYSERHGVEKLAKVADDWMTNVGGLTEIHPGSSKLGSLHTTKIIQPESACQKPDVHRAAEKI